ncbi:helix-turn-helix transcriptional regulator [Streptomyces sp. enrichment culture]|uniref:helix-turn-helix transcriptional regulator n=1 Tax=Streptomyces sp. enrichment culture TaxID=1795815 RepID=UPI003F55F7DA
MRSGAKLTVDDVCDELGIARSTFYDWRQKGRGPRCIRLPNGSLRIRRSDFENWLRRHFTWRDLAAVWGDDCCACRADGTGRLVVLVPAGGAAGAGSPAGRRASPAWGP